MPSTASRGSSQPIKDVEEIDKDDQDQVIEAIGQFGWWQVIENAFIDVTRKS